MITRLKKLNDDYQSRSSIRKCFHANQISIWKKRLLDAATVAFINGKNKDTEKKEVERGHLYQKVGQLQIKVD